MNRVLLFCFLILTSSLIKINAQEFDSIAFKYANTITASELKKHLYVIASDEYEGRETGRKGQKMAMEYLVNQFKSYGIQEGDHGFTQSFKLLETKNENVHFTSNSQHFSINEDFILTPAFIKNQKIESALVFVGFGMSESKNYLKSDIENKVVLIIKDIPEKIGKESIKSRIEEIKKYQPKAILVYDTSVEGKLKKYRRYFGNPKMKLGDEIDEEVATLYINNKVLKSLNESNFNWSKALKKGLKKPKVINSSVSIIIEKPYDYLSSENILAFIPGEEKKDELLVITAHYDHIGKNDSLIFNGADDDGTGTVTLLELAQAFMHAKTEGYKFKRSILIMHVSGEEKGLLGSRYYSDNPVFPLENTVTNLNVDMIGRYDEAHENDSNYIYLIGSDKLSADLHQLSEKVNDLYSNVNLDYKYNDDKDPNRFYYRSDHYNFAKNGIPVIFYFSGTHEDYHKATDTVEKIDYEKTARIAKLIFYTAWHIVNRDERIIVD